VTQAQWEAVMENNPSRFQGWNHPVENVSWNDVQEFIRRLKTKKWDERYRLPTEAEWEYACRAGTTTRYSFGDDANSLGRHAWHEDNSRGETHPVGRKEANAWGLYDMHGNVREWVLDWFDDYSSAGTPDPGEPSPGGSRVYRGGGWNDGARLCRAASRSWGVPDSRRGDLGFRLALSPE
jgi:formylglycine-generating enzyme required for sulfatase activity